MPRPVPVSLHALHLGDDPAAWERLGFRAGDDGVVALGGVELRCTGEGGGVRGWVLGGDGPDDAIDGIPTRREPVAAAPAAEHPNGATAIDHVVVLTGRRDRTVAALESAGGDLRRQAEPPAVPARMAFVRLGAVIVEVVEARDPVRIWGLVAVVADVDALAAELGDAVGRVKDAVQPGRRIVTARPAPGLETAVAFITPRG